MAFEDHRWHPDEAQAISSYYAVYKETVNSHGIFSGANFNPANISIEDKMAEIRNEFVAILRKLINYEKGKELNLIKAFLDKYGIDLEFRSLLEGCLKNNDFTKAFNYIHIKQHNIQEGVAKLPYNLEKWNEYMQSYMNIYIKKTAEEAIKNMNDIGNMSPEAIAKEMLNYLRINYKGESNYKNNFMNFMQTFEDELMPLLKENKVFGGKNWNIPTNQIELEKSKASTNQTIIEKYTSIIIAGIVNGLSQEEFIVSTYGGASTARATRKLNFFSGKSQNVQTETDAYLVLDFGLTANKQANEMIKQLQTDTAIKNFINQIPENDFIIHYSSKDASISLASKGTGSAKIGKIKGKGSLDSKIPVLQNLGMEGGFSPNNIDNMIFTIVNNGAGLVNEGKGINEITQAITTLVIGFMFEDFEDQLQNMVSGLSNNEVHLYFLSGKFVPISAILEQFIAQIEKTITNKVVSVGITPAKTLYTSKAEYGKDRWNFVREKTIGATQMDIYILNNLLNNLGI